MYTTTKQQWPINVNPHPHPPHYGSTEAIWFSPDFDMAFLLSQQKAKKMSKVFLRKYLCFHVQFLNFECNVKSPGSPGCCGIGTWGFDTFILYLPWGNWRFDLSNPHLPRTGGGGGLTLIGALGTELCYLSSLLAQWLLAAGSTLNSSSL